VPWLVVAGLFFGCAGPGGAVDGRIDVRVSHQSGQVGDLEYDAETRREELTLDQPIPLGGAFLLQTRLRWLREASDSRAGGPRQEWEGRTTRPDVTLSYRARGLTLGAQGDWFERRITGESAFAPRSRRYQYGGWVNGRRGGTRLSGNWTRSVSEQKGLSAGDVENRETSGAFRGEQSFARVWQAAYRLAGTSSDAVDRAIRRTHLVHGLEFGGTPRLGDRLDASIQAKTQLFSETLETGAPSDAGIYLEPLAGDVRLDDTPESYDPLEGDPAPEPGLYDGDRESPTGLDLGDAASVVREFGGDYRNIRYDFGGIEELVSAFLFVDRRLLAPGLLRWRLFVTDDPEGRLWNELGPGQADVSYREWDEAHQGWEVRFARGVSGRRVMWVDVKIGPTVPELFVNELEVYVRGDARESTVRSQNHRLDFGVGYRLTGRLHLRYQGSARERVFEGDGRDLSERNHILSTRWSSGPYILLAQYQLYTLSGPTRRDSDVDGYRLSASRGHATRWSSDLAYSRSHDRSRDTDRTDDLLSLSTSWRAASRLRLSQRVTFGWRADRRLDDEARSIALVTTIQSSPWTRLTLDVDRTDRWVSRAVGAGFEPFNDTELAVTWSPVPLISLSSIVRYTVRATSDWTTRNAVSWTPFPGGDVQLRFSGHDVYDSRTETSRRGAGASLTWRPRPRLIVEGGVDVQRFELLGETNTPLSTQGRLTWSF
jgi:hypothetical protein